MKRSQFVLALLIWTALLGLSMAWASSPVLRPPGKDISQITEQKVAESFSVRLAPLRFEIQAGAKSRFDYDDWALRETRRRVILLLVIWLTGNASLCLIWVKKRPPGTKA